MCSECVQGGLIAECTCLECQSGQLEYDVRVYLEGSPEDEAPGLEVEQLHRPVLRQVGDGLDEELDQEVDRQRRRLPGKVVVQNLKKNSQCNLVWL